jgi:hypothetical protein
MATANYQPSVFVRNGAEKVEVENQSLGNGLWFTDFYVGPGSKPRSKDPDENNAMRSDIYDIL